MEVVGIREDEDMVCPPLKGGDTQMRKLGLASFFTGVKNMPKLKDLTGIRYGKLVVLYRSADRVSASGSRSTMWTCRCDCGTVKDVSSVALMRGSTRSCGCSTAQLISAKNMNDLTGQRFGRLVVDKRADDRIAPSGKHYVMWACKCDCGNESVVRAESLLSGDTTSCGCYQREIAVRTNSTHGDSCTRLYSIWHGMKRRCCDKDHPAYINYGGRGIMVCEDWLNDYLTFREWAIEAGYSDDLSIDRIDTNAGYSPSNCRWANAQEQALNRRSNKRLTFGDETHTISEWADITGIAYDTLRARVFVRKWSVEKALTTPVRSN